MNKNYIHLIVKNLDQAEDYVQKLLYHINAIRDIKREMDSYDHRLDVELEFVAEEDKAATNR